MYNTYRPFLDRLIQRYEGGYTWDKGDPGGPTKYGITCYDLAEFQGKKMTSMGAWAQAVKDMTLTTAEAIYWQKYALGIRYNGLPAGIDVTMMDYAVNSGLSRPIHVACALLGLKDRGVMDNELARGLGAVDPKTFVSEMDAERLRFMHAIRHGDAWKEFGRGWGARVADVKTYAMKLVASPLQPVPADPPTVPTKLPMAPTPKAVHHDPDLPSHIGHGIGGTIASAIAGKLGGVPMEFVLGGVVFAVLLGVAWYFYRSKTTAALNAAVTDVAKITGATGPTGS